MTLALPAMLVTSGAADAKTKVMLVHAGAWTIGNPATMEPLRADLRTKGISSRSLTYLTEGSAFIPAQHGMTASQVNRMSPLRRLTKNAAPTLLLHGDADAIVPLSQSQRFVRAARRYQRDVALLTMRGMGHLDATPIVYANRASKWIKHPMRRQARNSRR